MKKGFSLILAAGFVLSGLTALTAYASADVPEDASTYCFDDDVNTDRLSDWEFYGSTDAVKLSLAIDTDVKEEGAGSLRVSANVGNAGVSEKHGGAFITPDKVGLEDFSGCTMRISYRFAENSKDIDSFFIFTNGIIWNQTNIIPDPEARRPQWGIAEITVPATSKNNQFGFSIPTYTPNFSGTAVYIDNLVIIDSEGNAVANVGDYKTPAGSSSLFDTLGDGTVIVLFAVLFIVLGGITFGVVYIVRNMKKKFT